MFTDISDGFLTTETFWGVFGSKAILTIGLIVFHRKLNGRYLCPAIGANEAVLMPGLVLIGHPIRHYYLWLKLSINLLEPIKWRHTSLHLTQRVAYLCSKQLVHKISFSRGTKGLFPIGIWHLKHEKQFSCHCFPLYSIFFIPKHISRIKTIETIDWIEWRSDLLWRHLRIRRTGWRTLRYSTHCNRRDLIWCRIVAR